MYNVTRVVHAANGAGADVHSSDGYIVLVSPQITGTTLPAAH